MSTKDFTIFIEGTPRSKQRPRTLVNRSTKTGKTWTYNPSITNEYCQYLRLKAREYMKTKGLKPFPLDIPVSILLKFHLQRITTKKGEMARPDVNNLANNALDAISGELFTDDAQIICLIAEKEKCPKGKEGVRIGVHAGS